MKIHFAFLSIVLCALLSFASCSLQAQDTVRENTSNSKAQAYKMGNYLNGRLSLKVGYKYKLGFNIELNYTFLNILEVGLYTGIDRYYATPDPDSLYFDESGKLQAIPSTYPTTSPFALLMGVNLNIHILPLFIRESKFRFDLYISNKFYTAYAFLPSNHPYKTRFLPFHAETGLGFSCYFTPRFGMYIEGSYQYQDKFKADMISSYKKEEDIGRSNAFHGRIGFTFKLNK